MNERERLFAKIAQGPKSVSIADLEKLMTLWGFVNRRNGKGDGIIFRHPAFCVMVTAAIPHHGPVKVAYVRNCLNAVEEVQIKEMNSDA